MVAGKVRQPQFIAEREPPRTVRAALTQAYIKPALLTGNTRELRATLPLSAAAEQVYLSLAAVRSRPGTCVCACPSAIDGAPLATHQCQGHSCGEQQAGGGGKQHSTPTHAQRQDLSRHQRPRHRAQTPYRNGRPDARGTDVRRIQHGGQGIQHQLAANGAEPGRGPRQQQQIDRLERELAQLRQQQPEAGGAVFRSLRDELPPHY